VGWAERGRESFSGGEKRTEKNEEKQLLPSILLRKKAPHRSVHEGANAAKDRRTKKKTDSYKREDSKEKWGGRPAAVLAVRVSSRKKKGAADILKKGQGDACDTRRWRKEKT